MARRVANQRLGRSTSRRAQRGVALLGLLAVAVMVFAYALTSRLNAASQFVAIDRDHNGKVMSQAKRALIGWMAMNAAGIDDNPGRLLCPEAPGDFGTANEGRAASSCTPPNNVGRLPWRTLGLEKLVDSAGEPLWYAVSQGWSLPGANTTPINSNSAGGLSFNGVPNDAVATIIAPGAVLLVQAGGTCTAKVQSRPVAGPPAANNYLECGNEIGNFVTSAAGQPFNDQVLRISAADVMPALEAAIQQRMQREIAPALRGVYASAQWGLTSTNPLYPFAAPFSNPGLSSFEGANDEYQGLLPFTRSETSPGSGLPCPADVRCNPLFVAWTGGTLSGPSIRSPSCSVSTGATTQLDCTFYYTCGLLFCTPPTLNYTIQAQAARVGRALRQINTSVMVGSANVTATLGSVSGAFSSNGAATLTLTGTVRPDGSGVTLSSILGNLFCGLPILGPLLGCKESLISVPISILADHSLLDANHATYGWFVRNEWYRLVYYAAAQRNTPDGLTSGLGCALASSCLQFNNTRNIRSLLVLAGRSINNPAGRPNGTLSDYMEYQNGDVGTIYEQRPPRKSPISILALNAPFNDRVVLVDWVAPAPSIPLASLP